MQMYKCDSQYDETRAQIKEMPDNVLLRNF